MRDNDLWGCWRWCHADVGLHNDAIWLSVGYYWALWPLQVRGPERWMARPGQPEPALFVLSADGLLSGQLNDMLAVALDPHATRAAARADGQIE